MPFASKAQQRRFFADPRLQKYAKEWAKGTDFKHLPERLHKTKDVKRRIAERLAK
jgi:hypothetical protein